MKDRDEPRAGRLTADDLDRSIAERTRFAIAAGIDPGDSPTIEQQLYMAQRAVIKRPPPPRPRPARGSGIAAGVLVVPLAWLAIVALCAGVAIVFR